MKKILVVSAMFFVLMLYKFDLWGNKEDVAKNRITEKRYIQVFL